MRLEVRSLIQIRKKGDRPHIKLPPEQGLLTPKEVEFLLLSKSVVNSSSGTLSFFRKRELFAR